MKSVLLLSLVSISFSAAAEEVKNEELLETAVIRPIALTLRQQLERTQFVKSAKSSKSCPDGKVRFDGDKIIIYSDYSNGSYVGPYGQFPLVSQETIEKKILKLPGGGDNNCVTAHSAKFEESASMMEYSRTSKTQCDKPKSEYEGRESNVNANLSVKKLSRKTDFYSIDYWVVANGERQILCSYVSTPPKAR